MGINSVDLAAVPAARGGVLGRMAPSARLPAVSMQPRFSPALEPRTEQHCYRSVILNAEVVKNDKYPHTITENTGDPNWETVHVTFDHEGKFPYLEGMSLGVISPGQDKRGQTPA